jgi:dinuclear metal center YbgI/SA1388 family protein
MMLSVKELIQPIEQIAPLALQESYDNAGIQVGTYQHMVNNALIAFDMTEEVLDEAIAIGAKLIITHHPLIFKDLKKIAESNSTERIIKKAILHDIVIYAAHTNFDNCYEGLNFSFAHRIGLTNIKILAPLKDKLLKFVVFVPLEHVEKVREAIFSAGAGFIGNYDKCSYNLEGFGTFRANEKAQPFVGEINSFHQEKEMRIEVILPIYLLNKVLHAMKSAHPYEEPAYDIYPLQNSYDRAGAGIIGEFEESIPVLDFFKLLKNNLDLQLIKHTAIVKEKIKKVAYCGGSGSFLLKNAISQGADVFISGDFKYHQYFETENKIIIADIGHYESEIFSCQIFYDVIKKNFPNFAVHLSKVNTNPINYYK